jgi:hypothetical protein
MLSLQFIGALILALLVYLIKVWFAKNLLNWS